MVKSMMTSAFHLLLAYSAAKAIHLEKETKLD